MKAEKGFSGETGEPSCHLDFYLCSGTWQEHIMSHRKEMWVVGVPVNSESHSLVWHGPVGPSHPWAPLHYGDDERPTVSPTCRATQTGPAVLHHPLGLHTHKYTNNNKAMMDVKVNISGNMDLPPPRVCSYGHRGWSPTLDTKLLERACTIKEVCLCSAWPPRQMLPTLLPRRAF